MIYAFTGKKYSGKSTACQMMREILAETTTINFKDGLVEEMKKNFPDVLKELLLDEGEAVNSVHDLFRQKPPIMRALMQNYGTEVRRGDDPDCWVKLWKQKVTYTKGDVLTDDVRFLNEAEAIRDFDGVIIRIIRNDNESLDSHISEREMDKIKVDHTIEVDGGDLEGLKSKLLAVVS